MQSNWAIDESLPKNVWAILQYTFEVAQLMKENNSYFIQQHFADTKQPTLEEANKKRLNAKTKRAHENMQKQTHTQKQRRVFQTNLIS